MFCAIEAHSAGTPTRTPKQPLHQLLQRHYQLLTREESISIAGNYEYGKVHRRKFAFAYQGNYWGNHHGGETVAALLAARLQNSTRTTRDASAADVFFIPLSTRNSLVAQMAVRPWRKNCGVDFISGRNITRMWRWLLEQPSFQESDGSDHFLVIEPPKAHMANVRHFSASVCQGIACAGNQTDRQCCNCTIAMIEACMWPPAASLIVASAC